MKFDPDRPIELQRNNWGCFPNSLSWAVEGLGIRMDREALGLVAVRNKIITPRGYLVDKSGNDLADFSREMLADYGLAALYLFDVSFDQISREAGLYPLVIGSGSWLHYAAVRGYDPVADVLLLANTSPGWQGVGYTMNRTQFGGYSPISLTRVATPDLIGQVEEEYRHNARRGFVDREIRPRTIWQPAHYPLREGPSAWLQYPKKV
jgi:hypothetical protein